MTVSAALVEAYASGFEDGVVLVTAEIDHASLEIPARVVTGIDTPQGDEALTIDLPLVEGGERMPHIVCPFTVIPPGQDHDGPTDAKVAIDNVSDVLRELFKSALGYNLPVRITFRFYRMLPGQLAAITGPDDDIPGLLLRSVDLNGDRAEGTLAWPDGRRQNVPTGPNAFFDSENYPGLFGR